MINNISTQLTIRNKIYQVNWDLQQVNILVGNNGSGKTRILLQLSKEYKCFPIHIKDFDYGILSVGMSIFTEVINWYKELTDKQIQLDFDLVEYTDLSSGERYLLDLLTNIHVRPRNSTILIDDIEQNLDLRTQQKLLDFLVEQRPDLQFIVTTHSPSIFGKNFGNNVTFINNILTEI